MRLIDADALFKEYERVGWYNNMDRDEIAEEILLQMPTIDAVPVVRCKDCKRYYNEPLYDDQRDNCCTLHKGLVKITPNSFCSYGERKDNG